MHAVLASSSRFLLIDVINVKGKIKKNTKNAFSSKKMFVNVNNTRYILFLLAFNVEPID